LREFYPALLQAFAHKRGGLLRPEARALLAAAPTPRAAARLSLPRLRALLRRAGLQRGLDAEAARLQQVLRGDYLHHAALRGSCRPGRLLHRCRDFGARSSANTASQPSGLLAR
jgi:hypothetical protein